MVRYIMVFVLAIFELPPGNINSSWFKLLQSVTLHTNLGDIKCEIFCDEVPKSAEVCFFCTQLMCRFDLFSLN